jgi:hypothetical protein
VDISPAGTGTIQLNQTTPAAYPNNSTFGSGESVRLEAVPNSGYRFVGWSGAFSGNDNPTTISMTCNKKVIANFSKIMHILTIRVKGSGSTSPADGIYNYAEGAVVNITARPDKGWVFSDWTGDVANPDSATTTLTLEADKTLVANFSQKVHFLTIKESGGGSTSPAAGTYEYIEGTSVDITCKPDEGWHFVNWVGDVANPEKPTTIVTLDADKTLVANFHKPEHNWWLIGGTVAGLLIIALATGLIIRARAS